MKDPGEDVEWEIVPRCFCYMKLSELKQIKNLSIDISCFIHHLIHKGKWKLLSRVWLFATWWTIQSMEFSRPEYWSGYTFPSPRDLPNPGIKPRAPTSQEDSLQLSHKGSPKILEWVAYPSSSGSSQPRNQTGVFCITGRFFTNWAIRETIENKIMKNKIKQF